MTYPFVFNARVEDGAFHSYPLAPPLAGAETIVGFFPPGPGRTYRLEQDGDGARVFLVEGGAARTGDAGPPSPASINKRNTEFWALRTGSKPAPNR